MVGPLDIILRVLVTIRSGNSARQLINCIGRCAHMTVQWYLEHWQLRIGDSAREIID